MLESPFPSLVGWVLTWVLGECAAGVGARCHPTAGHPLPNDAEAGREYDMGIHCLLIRQVCRYMGVQQRHGRRRGCRHDLNIASRSMHTAPYLAAAVCIGPGRSGTAEKKRTQRRRGLLTACLPACLPAYLASALPPSLPLPLGVTRLRRCSATSPGQLPQRRQSAPASCHGVHGGGARHGRSSKPIRCG